MIHYLAILAVHFGICFAILALYFTILALHFAILGLHFEKGIFPKVTCFPILKRNGLWEGHLVAISLGKREGVKERRLKEIERPGKGVNKEKL